jgi:hypothetical protein
MSVQDVLDNQFKRLNEIVSAEIEKAELRFIVDATEYEYSVIWEVIERTQKNFKISFERDGDKEFLIYESYSS